MGVIRVPTTYQLRYGKVGGLAATLHATGPDVHDMLAFRAQLSDICGIGCAGPRDQSGGQDRTVIDDLMKVLAPVG